ncbi:hypothetical protein KKG31_06465 [Patescibacteria group bacterium]|nr:hypothetical protein [Patescibacteria group bacterium]MBU1758738.1 hypothetical protein [Patescibacteria group bacterium]
MSEGFDYENILTIGFCNIADQKADYMKAFDIVIMNDP